jgi:hypothetical protein
MFKPEELVSTLANKEDVKKFLTEQARKDISIWIDNKLLPAVKEGLDEFIKGLREAAENETGWCKIRDKVFIPAVLTIILWAFTQMSAFIQKETDTSK